MRTICIMNYKGGVGKTTTAVNLAAGIARHDKRVILVDLDPQGNVDLSLQVGAEFTIYDAMTGKVPIQRCAVSLGKNLDVITSKETLIKAEQYLATQSNKMILKELLEKIDDYDYMIIDCPPSLGILNQNVLAFSQEIFVPTSTDFLGHDAVRKMQEIVDNINESYGSNAKISKIIPTLYDQRNRICKETLTGLQQDFPGKVTNPIRMNSKLKEAPKYGKSIFKYARSSPGAKDYGQLTDAIVEMELSVETI